MWTLRLVLVKVSALRTRSTKPYIFTTQLKRCLNVIDDDDDDDDDDVL